MRQVKLLSIFIGIAIIMSLFLFACEKRESENPNMEGAIQFVINQSSVKTTTSLKEYSISDVRTAVITIQTSSGEATQVTSLELPVQNMNGGFYIQGITLKIGEYELIEFLLLDELGNTIYATPIEGSELAVHVFNPLPVVFNVTENLVTSVSIEVLSTENYVPEQFGLVSFAIIEIPTFNFILGVVDAVSNEVITAKLTLTDGTYTLEKELDSMLTNLIVARDGFASYSIAIAKSGYIPVTHIYSADSLKMFIDTLNNPLIIELSPLPEGAIIDIDNNVYNTVIIGTQVWMAENLKTTRYNDGTEIPLIDEDIQWENGTAPAYCWYNDDSTTYANTYGALYKWSTVTGNLCPEGWHVPVRTEWLTLINYLGGSAIAGGKLKEADTLHWSNPNVGATNESGFTALPGGYRHDEEFFYGLGGLGIWWANTEDPIDYWGFDISISSSSSAVSVTTSPKARGEYVRCVKD